MVALASAHRAIGSGTRVPLGPDSNRLSGVRSLRCIHDKEGHARGQFGDRDLHATTDTVGHCRRGLDSYRSRMHRLAEPPFARSPRRSGRTGQECIAACMAGVRQVRSVSVVDTTPGNADYIGREPWAAGRILARCTSPEGISVAGRRSGRHGGPIADSGSDIFLGPVSGGCSRRPRTEAGDRVQSLDSRSFGSGIRLIPGDRIAGPGWHDSCSSRGSDAVDRNHRPRISSSSPRDHSSKGGC